MSKFVFSILVLFSVLGASAEAITPDEVCAGINRANPYLGNQCYDVIHRKLYDGQVLEACHRLAQGNAVYGIECLKVSGNVYYDSRDLQRCLDQEGNPYLFIECLKKISR